MCMHYIKLIDSIHELLTTIVVWVTGTSGPNGNTKIYWFINYGALKKSFYKTPVYVLWN